MSLDSFFRRQATKPERIDPPSLKVPEEDARCVEIQPESPARESVEADAESRFAELAAEFDMSPDDLRSLQLYKIWNDRAGADTIHGKEELSGIRGAIHGVAVDVKETRNPSTGSIEYVYELGGRAIEGDVGGSEFTRLNTAVQRRDAFDKAHESERDREMVRKTHGEAQ